jgi:hypothetical protein
MVSFKSSAMASSYGIGPRVDCHTQVGLSTYYFADRHISGMKLGRADKNERKM